MYRLFKSALLCITVSHFVTKHKNCHLVDTLAVEKKLNKLPLVQHNDVQLNFHIFRIVNQ